MKTLIVEDDPTSARVLQKLLENYGSSELADNGNQAIVLFAAAIHAGQPFDLVCMDIMLPGMDGHQTTRQIRALEVENGIGPENEVPIIMTTALDDLKSQVDAFNLGGATAYMTKPVTKAKVRAELERLGLGQNAG